MSSVHNWSSLYVEICVLRRGVRCYEKNPIELDWRWSPLSWAALCKSLARGTSFTQKQRTFNFYCQVWQVFIDKWHQTYCLSKHHYHWTWYLPNIFLSQNIISSPPFIRLQSQSILSANICLSDQKISVWSSYLSLSHRHQSEFTLFFLIWLFPNSPSYLLLAS